MEESSRQQELLSLTTELVAAFVGNHTIGVGDIPHLISGVFGALSCASRFCSTQFLLRLRTCERDLAFKS
jgi:predicted transcriptional regulator